MPFLHKLISFSYLAERNVTAQKRRSQAMLKADSIWFCFYSRFSHSMNAKGRVTVTKDRVCCYVRVDTSPLQVHSSITLSELNSPWAVVITLGTWFSVTEIKTLPRKYIYYFQFFFRRNNAVLNVTSWVNSATFMLNAPVLWGMRWRSLLRHCATSPKVAGSISGGGVIGVDSAFGYQGYVLGVRRPVRRADNIATFMSCLEILGAWTSWSLKGLSRPA
jgi:hypothetical protein